VSGGGHQEQPVNSMSTGGGQKEGQRGRRWNGGAGIGTGAEKNRTGKTTAKSRAAKAKAFRGRQRGGDGSQQQVKRGGKRTRGRRDPETESSEGRERRGSMETRRSRSKPRPMGGEKKRGEAKRVPIRPIREARGHGREVEGKG